VPDRSAGKRLQLGAQSWAHGLLDDGDMTTPMLTISRIVALAVLLRSAPSHASGLDEEPQPGELGPVEMAPERHRTGLNFMLAFPLGRARAQVAHSLGLRGNTVRWLHSNLGLALAFEQMVLAKSGGLPRAMEVRLRAATAGFRSEWKCSQRHALFAEASAVIQQKSISYRGRKLVERAIGGSTSAGVTATVAPRVYAVLRVSYVSAHHRMAVVEVGFESGF